MTDGMKMWHFQGSYGGHISVTHVTTQGATCGIDDVINQQSEVAAHYASQGID